MDYITSTKVVNVLINFDEAGISSLDQSQEDKNKSLKLAQKLNSKNIIFTKIRGKVTDKLSLKKVEKR